MQTKTSDVSKRFTNIYGPVLLRHYIYIITPILVCWDLSILCFFSPHSSIYIKSDCERTVRNWNFIFCSIRFFSWIFWVWLILIQISLHSFFCEMMSLMSLDQNYLLSERIVNISKKGSSGDVKCFKLQLWIWIGTLKIGLPFLQSLICLFILFWKPLMWLTIVFPIYVS